jgi:hypothetical protein
MTTSQKVKERLSARRGKVLPPPPLEVNSNGSTPTPARRLFALGLMMDFRRVHQSGLFKFLNIKYII